MLAFKMKKQTIIPSFVWGVVCLCTLVCGCLCLCVCVIYIGVHLQNDVNDGNVASGFYMRHKSCLFASWLKIIRIIHFTYVFMLYVWLLRILCIRETCTVSMCGLEDVVFCLDKTIRSNMRRSTDWASNENRNSRRLWILGEWTKQSQTKTRGRITERGREKDPLRRV